MTYIYQSHGPKSPLETIDSCLVEVHGSTGKALERIGVSQETLETMLYSVGTGLHLLSLVSMPFTFPVTLMHSYLGAISAIDTSKRAAVYQSDIATQREKTKESGAKLCAAAFYSFGMYAALHHGYHLSQRGNAENLALFAMGLGLVCYYGAEYLYRSRNESSSGPKNGSKRPKDREQELAYVPVRSTDSRRWRR